MCASLAEVRPVAKASVQLGLRSSYCEGVGRARQNERSRSQATGPRAPRQNGTSVCPRPALGDSHDLDAYAHVMAPREAVDLQHSYVHLRPRGTADVFVKKNVGVTTEGDTTVVWDPQVEGLLASEAEMTQDSGHQGERHLD